MLVGDIIYNDHFDCNCNYAVYDCSEKGAVHDDGGKLVSSTLRQHHKLKEKMERNLFAGSFHCVKI